MRAWFHSWQQKTSKMMKIVQIGVLLAVIALIVLFILGYIFNWTWTGVGSYVSPIHPQGSDFQREKTLYDWFQLAIIPVALAVGVWWLNRLQQQRDQQLADQRAKRERETATDNQHEAALQGYIDSMSELLLEKQLRNSKPEDEVRTIARVRTLTVIARLNEARKRNIIEFLYEAGLIDRDKAIISLKGVDLANVCLDRVNLRRVNLAGAYLQGAFINFRADLSEADLQGANLSDVRLTLSSLEGANLCRTNLIGASLMSMNLRGANFEGSHIFGKLSFSNLDRANLKNANLKEADLSYTSLVGADLSYADLEGANLKEADLTNANLTGANLTRVVITKAVITKEQLDKARSSKSAIGIDTIRATKPSPNEAVFIDEI